MKIAPDDQLAIDAVKLGDILDQYDLSLLSFTEASSGIENKTIIADTDRGKYVVRIYRNGKKSDQSIGMELDFMVYLHSNGVPVPGVLRNRSDQYITKLTFDGRMWQIIVMGYINGEHAAQYTEELISDMAKTQAAMHSLSAAYPAKGLPAENLDVLKEEYFIRQIDLHHLEDDRLKGFLERATNYVIDLGADLPRGLCHLDYDTDNLLSKDSSVLAVLDFDDLAIAPFIVCLAYTLWHVYTEESEAAAWRYLKDYEVYRQISDLERSYIKPVMLFRHYVISAIKVLNHRTLETDIEKYLDIESQLSNDLSKYFKNDHITVRRALRTDVDELVKIINDSYSYQDEARGQPRTNSSHLTKRMTETDFYVIDCDQVIAGCVYLEKQSNALHFGLLTLAPKYRGKGIAKDVIFAIENYGKSNHFVTLELDYMSVAPWLKGYYENYGFVQTDQVIHWGNIDLFRMRKSL